MTERLSGVRAADAREVALVGFLIAAVTFVVIWLSDATILFTRPLWVDEWFTVLVVGRASPAGVIAELRNGADGGASLLHLLVWALQAIAGAPLAPALLRGLSLLFVWIALLLVFVVLRRRFGRDASIAGALAVGSHGFVVAHAFEGRFYALWLLCCALFAWSLALNERPTRRHGVIVAIAAILLCTSHWYGIFTLALMCSAVLASYGPRWRDGVLVIAPSVAGLLVFVAVSPLAAGQRAMISVNTWIPDFTTRQLRELSGAFWTATVPALAGVGAVVGAALSRWRDAGHSVSALARGALRDAGVVALASLALMPLALAALSLLGQPSMLARYAIPAALAWGPLVAFAMQLLGRWAAGAFAIVLAGFWFVSFTREVASKRAFAAVVAYEARTVREAQSMGLPIVFHSLHTMYPSVAADRRHDSLAVFLDLSDSALNALYPRTGRWDYLNKVVTLERDYARVHAARFGFPTLASQRGLDSTERFLFMATPDKLPLGMHDITALARGAFPNHRVVPVALTLLLLERPRERSRPSRSTSR